MMHCIFRFSLSLAPVSQYINIYKWYINTRSKSLLCDQCNSGQLNARSELVRFPDWQLGQGTWLTLGTLRDHSENLHLRKATASLNVQMPILVFYFLQSIQKLKAAQLGCLALQSFNRHLFRKLVFLHMQILAEHVLTTAALFRAFPSNVRCKKVQCQPFCPKVAF